MYRRLLPVLWIGCLLLSGCNWFTNDDDTDSQAGWKQVTAFGSEPILGLYAASDGSGLQVMTPTVYGYCAQENGFITTSLNVALDYDAAAQSSHDLPYFTDDYCFYCNPDGDRMYIYAIDRGQWQKAMELNIHDLLPDSLNQQDRFGASFSSNRPNHIIQANGDNYFITTQIRDTTANKVYVEHFYITLSASTQSFSEIYHTSRFQSYCEGTDWACIYGTSYVNDRFFQGVLTTHESDRCMLAPDSPDYLPVFSNIGRLSDVINGPGCIMGIDNQRLGKSTDGGYSWPDSFMLLRGDGYRYWLHTIIDGNLLFFFNDQIIGWNSSQPQVAQSVATQGPRGRKINYLVQFGNKVYAGTDAGLFVKPLKDFF